MTVSVPEVPGKHMFDFHLTSNKCSGLVEQVFERTFSGQRRIQCPTPPAELPRWTNPHKQ